MGAGMAAVRGLVPITARPHRPALPLTPGKGKHHGSSATIKPEAELSRESVLCPGQGCPGAERGDLARREVSCWGGGGS